MNSKSPLDPATLDAFEAQMTEDSFRAVLEAAPSDDAVVVVQDAITDTLNGVVRWEPDAATLAAHLRDVVARALGDGGGGWRPARRQIFELLDFTRVRLELAWRDLR